MDELLQKDPTGHIVHNITGFSDLELAEEAARHFEKYFQCVLRRSNDIAFIVADAEFFFKGGLMPYEVLKQNHFDSSQVPRDEKTEGLDNIILRHIKTNACEEDIREEIKRHVSLFEKRFVDLVYIAEYNGHIGHNIGLRGARHAIKNRLEHLDLEARKRLKSKAHRRNLNPTAPPVEVVVTPPMTKTQHEEVWGYERGSAFKLGRPLRIIWDSAGEGRSRSLSCTLLLPHIMQFRKDKRWTAPKTAEDVLNMYTTPEKWR